MSGNGGNSAQNNTVHLKICPLAAAGCCQMSQNVFTENACYCAQITQATWYHWSSFLREGPSGQRMNVGRHNNVKISLLNGLVWTHQGRKEREREPDSHSLLPLLYSVQISATGNRSRCCWSEPGPWSSLMCCQKSAGFVLWNQIEQF